MKKYVYFVTFQNSDLTVEAVKVRAFDSDEAVILAQAARINDGKSYDTWIGVSRPQND